MRIKYISEAAANRYAAMASCKLNEIAREGRSGAVFEKYMQADKNFTSRRFLMPPIEELKAGGYTKKSEENRRIITGAQDRFRQAFEKANILERDIANARNHKESEQKINSIWEEGAKKMDALRKGYGR